MHVRYLQHHNSETVKLVLMPISSFVSQDSMKKKLNGENDGDYVSIPLPIQSFLWRQTYPFLGVKQAKMQDASCMAFERVLVQNILHGLSPTLSDSIASIPRWDFVRSAFPHIIQCCSWLIADRAKECEEEGEVPPMSGSLVKIYYILHWLLIDAASECNENISATVDPASIRKLTYPISSIQLFVYLLSPLFCNIKEEEISGHIRLESGVFIWKSLLQHQIPELLTFSAPVKPRRYQLPQIVGNHVGRKNTTLGLEKSVYLGGESSPGAPGYSRRPSQLPPQKPPPATLSSTIQHSSVPTDDGIAKSENLIPPPKPPRTDLNILREIHQNRKISRIVECDKQKETIAKANNVAAPAGIIRSVSEYKSSELAKSARASFRLRKSDTGTGTSPDSEYDGFGPITEIDNAMRFADEADSSVFNAGSICGAAPLANIQDICSEVSITIEPEDFVSQQQQQKVAYLSPPPILAKNTVHEDFGGNPFTESLTTPATAMNKSTSTISTLIPPSSILQPPPPPKVNHWDDESLKSSKKISGSDHSDKPEPYDPHEANYLDVAVIRCLLVKNWAEEGVFWGVMYFQNRLKSIRAYRSINGYRSVLRRKSVPITASRKTTSGDLNCIIWSNLKQTDTLFPHQDHDGGSIIADEQHFSQQHSPYSGRVAIRRESALTSKTLVPSSVSVVSCGQRRVRRSRSEPGAIAVFTATTIDAQRAVHREKEPQQVPFRSQDKRRKSVFFPEAIGSSSFIDKNGHVCFRVILKTLGSLVERCSILRIFEVVLNICDILLNMPDENAYFAEILNIVEKISLQLGCTNGCRSEGSGGKNLQNDFLLVKLKNLLTQMHKQNAEKFVELLKAQAAAMPIRQLIDYLHSLTSFCQISSTDRRLRAVKTPYHALLLNGSYNNRFNEVRLGLEGILVGAVFKEVVSKLLKETAEFGLPENMAYYRDIRLFTLYVQEKHGNPFRKSALSALMVKPETVNETAVHSRLHQNKMMSGGLIESHKSSSGGNLLVPGTLIQKDRSTRDRGFFWRKEKVVVERTNESDSSTGETPPPNVFSSCTDEPLLNVVAQTPATFPFSQQLTLGQAAKKKQVGVVKLHFALNLLKSIRPDEEEMDESSSVLNLDECSSDVVSPDNALQEFKGRVSSSSFRATSPRPLDLEAAIELKIPAFLPPQQIVLIDGIREGASRFAFLLETCHPGTVPDAPLIGAITELKSTVLARAVLLLECANFVYRCNRGDWPEWIRSGPTPRLTAVGIASMRTAGTALSRRTILLQKAAGRNFYYWGLQLGMRLQRFIDSNTNERRGKTQSKKQLKLFDDIENFLDDGTISPEYNTRVIPVLQLMAYVLLQQITAFLRETFQAICKSKAAQKATANGSGWEKQQNTRRWSILSNTFGPVQQTAGGSIQSINDSQVIYPQERRVSYSTLDGNSSPRESHDLCGDDQGASEKKELPPRSMTTQLPAVMFKRLASKSGFLTQQSHDPTMGISSDPDSGSGKIVANINNSPNIEQQSKGGLQQRPQRIKHALSTSILGPPSLGVSPSLSQSSSIVANAKHTGTSTAVFVAVSTGIADSVRRLAQQRQRLLKRSGSPGSQKRNFKTSFMRESSIRLRKLSKPLSSFNEAATPPVSTDEVARAELAQQPAASAAFGQSFPADSRPFSRNRAKAMSVKPHLFRFQAQGWPTRIRSPIGIESRSSLQMVSEETTRERLEKSSKYSIKRGISGTGLLKPSTASVLSMTDKSSTTSKTKGQADETFSQPSTSKIKTSPERQTTTALSQTSATPGLGSEDTEEEEHIMKNMPWLNTCKNFCLQFDFECRHTPFCTEFCFERVYRQCHRLCSAIDLVYDRDGRRKDENCLNRRQILLDSWRAHQDELKTGKRTSNQHYRESACVRQSAVERMPHSLKGLLIEKMIESSADEAKTATKREELASSCNPAELFNKRVGMHSFLRSQLLVAVHAPLSALLKAALLLPTELQQQIVPICWSLLTHGDLHVVASAASMFIFCAVKCLDVCTQVMTRDMNSTEPTRRTNAVQRFFALWRNRFHIWLKMEEGAQLVFKVPPPSIDFALPSPAIGQSQLPVVDPPWIPYVRTKVEELSLKEEEHATSQTIMTMTRTRRKQKQEMVRKAVREAENRQRELREQFQLRASAILQQAAYEPALFYHSTTLVPSIVEGVGADCVTVEPGVVHQTLRQQMPVAMPLFPSSILSVVPNIIEMLEDAQVDANGVSVSDYCRRIIWTCLVEDTALFLRHFFEKLTVRNKQEYLLALLRKLVTSFRPLPSQMAHSLLNYLFGFIMFYVRTPCEGAEKSLSSALGLIWIIIPYVQGLYFKDLKQTLKKEQCDQAIMITANVPSAKRIVIYGPDAQYGGIPTQLPIMEDTQFQQLLIDSLDYFQVSEHDLDAHFLVDTKTGVVHNPISYVRDFYFFHRSLYPQITLLQMDADEALFRMKEHSFFQKFIEIGKILLTHNALKYSAENIIPQRVFFLHDELTHLPSFPRRCLEACFGMYEGEMGEELQSADALHKFAWAKLISDLFEKMENAAFMFGGDLHLFVNVINGVMILHCEDLLVLRRCMATYLTIAIHFSTLFATQGFFLIMPTILRCYSQRQTNKMFIQVVEFVCKQFYILHRKPFLLQMFGSIADICDQNNNDLEVNVMLIKAKYLFGLLLAMENMNDCVDQLDILSLVPHPKPLHSLDLCYKEEPNTFTVLLDAMASCVTVCVFAAETRRSHQMLLIMQSILPHYMEHMEKESLLASNSVSAIKHEISNYTILGVEMRSLISGCEALARGPTRSFEAGSVTERGKSFITSESPQFFDPPTVVEDESGKPQGAPVSAANVQSNSSQKDKKYATSSLREAIQLSEQSSSTELQKELFRGPRDALLILSAMFAMRGSARVKELTKIAASMDHVRIGELLDHKSHVRLSDIAVALLKVAPYDLGIMGCTGLQKYFTCILPTVDWSVETSRSALNVILRRLDKCVAKIAKKPSTRRRANWVAISTWISGLHQTLINYPYVAHLHSLKTITFTCLRLMLGEGCSDEVLVLTIISSFSPPPIFCSAVLKLTSFMMTALGQAAFSLDIMCSAENLGLVAERPESVICNLLIPLFMRAMHPTKEASQFQSKDIHYCLNEIAASINPNLNANANVGASVVRDSAGRQSSVSVMDRGHSATVSTHRMMIRDSVVQSVLLELKFIAVCLQKQITTHWTKLVRITKDLITKKIGGPSLLVFLEFLITSKSPISLLIIPTLMGRLSQRPANEQDSIWQSDLRERINKHKSSQNSELLTNCAYNMLKDLQKELQTMKENFSTRNLDLPRSHTPILGDIHSDSGSSQSVGATQHQFQRTESRRLSSSAMSRLRNMAGGSKSSSVSGTQVQESTIAEEDSEFETHQKTTTLEKGPTTIADSRKMFQSRRPRPHERFRSKSFRRRQTYERFEEEEPPDATTQHTESRSIHRRAKSLRGGRAGIIKQSSVPATAHSELVSFLAAQGPKELDRMVSESGSSLTKERARVVSFSTPRHSITSHSLSEGDSEEFCVTSKYHRI